MDAVFMVPIERDRLSFEYCREYSEYREEQLHRLYGGHKLEVLDPHFEENFKKGAYGKCYTKTGTK